MTADKGRPLRKLAAEQGARPFQLNVMWRTGPRTRAWDELLRRLLADPPKGAGDERGHAAPSDEDELREQLIRHHILPDAYFQLARATPDGVKRSPFFLEVKLSDKSECALREKFRHYAEFYYNGHFEQAFGTKALRVLWPIGDDYGIRPDRRVAKLSRLAQELGVTFQRLTALDTFPRCRPEEVFSASIWRRPDQDGLSAFF